MGATTKPRAWIPVLAFLVALLIIGTSGFLLFKQQALETERTAQEGLAAIADLKVARIVEWMTERRTDAMLIQRDHPVGSIVERWIEQGASEGMTAQIIGAWLSGLAQTGDYAVATLVDLKAHPRLSVGPTRRFDSDDAKLAIRAMHRNAVTFSDIHWRDDEKAGAELGVVAPLVVENPLGRRVIGAIHLRMDANDFFFPLIQSWPTKSPSGEALLVRQDGNEVLYLNELRHRKGAALNLRMPIDQPLLVAAMALRGEDKIVAGVDYRGVRVIAAARKVPDTPWILVVKLDRVEVEAPLRQFAGTLGGVLALLMLLTGASATLWWRKQHAQYLAALSEEKFQRQALEQHFDYATKYARDIILLLNETHRVIECNDAATAAYGYTREELLQLTLNELRAAQAIAALPGDLEKAERPGGATYETVHRRRDGSTFPVEVSRRFIELDGRQFYQSIVRDITERKAAERRISHVTRLYATLSHTNAAISHARTEQELFDQICRVAVEHGGMLGSVVRIADTETKVLRPVAHSESMRSVVEKIVVGFDPARPEFKSAFAIAYLEDRIVIDNSFAATDPAEPWREVTYAAGIRSAARIPVRRGGKPIGVLFLNATEPDFFDPEMLSLLEEMMIDISYALDNLEVERHHQQMERDLSESEDRFRVLVEQAISGIFIIEGEHLTYVNSRFAELFGYRPEELIGREYLSLVAEESRELVRQRIRTPQTVETARAPYSCACLRKDGSNFTLGAHGTTATIEGRPAIIGIAQDISEREQAQRQIQAHLEQLEQAMLGTVQAVSTMVEMRDPYTAGHEKRVGALARAIGAEMELPEETLRGLEITGSVHDIGKISIPAEILSKPSKLTELEYAIIKTHAQLGHDVFRGVKFPWPLAQAILQHHERVDGSGYPNGLKGEDIILEARILAVADTVEAMGSHRPYRPTRGIGAALEEIEKFRGLRYDPQAVDACLRLFREKGYQLPV